MQSVDHSAASRKKRNLKSTLVEPFKQIKLGLYVMAVSIVFLVAASALFLKAFVEQYRHVMEIFNVVDPKLQWDLVTNPVFVHNAEYIGGLFLVYIVVLFAVVFRMTHRYYGPLVSIERFVNQISEGDYSRRVTIRRGDELQRLTDQLNAMAVSLEERHGHGKGHGKTNAKVS